MKSQTKKKTQVCLRHPDAKSMRNNGSLNPALRFKRQANCDYDVVHDQAPKKTWSILPKMS